MVIGVIPARLHSQRFPRKILAPINGKPMVMHVYERARQAQSLDRVILAVDDHETVEALESYNAEIWMTAPELPSGSDRVAEVVRELEADIVVNIQGDEPTLDPRIIDQLVNLFQDEAVHMATAVSTILTGIDLLNSNCVKAILDEQHNAVLFRRNVAEKELGGCYRHVGIYAYRKETLLKFTQLPPSLNERKYRLEQLRALDNDIPIRAIITDYPYRGIDTEDDLEQLNQGN